jgi:hypothetical protein
VVEALRATFDGTYPEADFASVWASIEFPMEKNSYPGIWVQYEDTDEVAIAGIGHVEEYEDDQGFKHLVTRARFGGIITLTISALTSLERDRLYDELIRTLVFARREPQVSAFRTKIENNDLVAMNIDFDKIRPSGDAAAAGTPWGTDEMIYERSVSLNCLGEFVSRGNEIVRLSRIHTQGYVQGSPAPAFPDHPDDDVPDPGQGLPEHGTRFEFDVPSPRSQQPPWSDWR